MHADRISSSDSNSTSDIALPMHQDRLAVVSVFDRTLHGSVFDRTRHGSVFDRTRHGEIDKPEIALTQTQPVCRVGGIG
jgi:hypothetical protein